MSIVFLLTAITCSGRAIALRARQDGTLVAIQAEAGDQGRRARAVTRYRRECRRIGA
jgi:hypothetical protein